MKTINLLFLIAIASFYTRGQEGVSKEIEKFPGLWSLHTMEQKDSLTGEWGKWRKAMQGYILYDDKGTMAVHLTTASYQNTDLQFPNFDESISNEALQHLTNSYVYFAKYTVDAEKGVVQHARISHSNPSEWNEVVQRKFTFSGDTLILQPLESTNASLRLKWIKTAADMK